MYSPSTKNRVIAPIAIGIALILGAVIFRPTYLTYIENRDTLNSLQTEQTRLQSELQELERLKNNASTELTPEQLEKIEKLSRKFDVSDIMSTVMLNDFTRANVGSEAQISINSITVGEGSPQPNGLRLGKVAISFRGTTIPDIISYITYLTQDSPFVFTIDGISLPINTDPSIAPVRNLNMGIELGVYYYQ